MNIKQVSKLSLLVLLFPLHSFGSNIKATPITCEIFLQKDSIPADIKDVGNIDSIIAALYNVISGPKELKRNWDRFRTLFIPEARMIAVTRRRPDSTLGKRSISIEEYINLSSPLMEKDGFFEKEIFRKIDQYGNIVQLFSTYEARHAIINEKPFIRGINSIQLFNDGRRWWIISVFWQSETGDNPIPEKYIK